MTPLEQKAREYAEYEELCNIKVDHQLKEAYIAGYTEALRWRDVNEEAPKEPYEVLVKSTKGNHAIATYTNLTGWVLKPSIKGFGSIARWRPIETI